MKFTEHILRDKKKTCNLVKYNLRDIYIAHNNGRTDGFVKPFVINHDKTRIKDIENGEIIDIRDSYDFDYNITTTIDKYYSEMLGHLGYVKFSKIQDLILECPTLPKGTIFKEYCFDIVLYKNSNNLSQIKASAEDLKPVIKQINHYLVQKMKRTATQSEITSEDAEELNF